MREETKAIGGKEGPPGNACVMCCPVNAQCGKDMKTNEKTKKERISSKNPRTRSAVHNRFFTI